MNDLISMLQMFPHAVGAGMVIATACAMLGVFVILKRVVFIGIALSETAACGIALAMLVGLSPFLGAGILTFCAVILLAQPFETRRIPRDAILGVIFVLMGSLSILVVSKSGFGLHEIKALLYGDLILVSPAEFLIISAALLPVVVYLMVFLRPTLYTFLDRDAAQVMGIRVRRWEFLYFLALGLAVSAASKVAGALLVFCYLVVAPSAALLLSKRLGLVMVLAIGVAGLSTLAGMYWSFTRDLPTNQSISVAMCAIFGLAALGACARRRFFKC